MIMKLSVPNFRCTSGPLTVAPSFGSAKNTRGPAAGGGAAAGAGVAARLEAGVDSGVLDEHAATKTNRATDASCFIR
jgi:hypothetical protein